MRIYMCKGVILTTTCSSRFISDIYFRTSQQVLLQMQDFIGQDSNHNLLSPTLFISGLQAPCSHPSFELDRQDSFLQPELARESTIRGSQDGGTRDSQKDDKKRLAGLKSRERKKKYLQSLQESVKQLSVSIESTESQISKCKDRLVQAIRTSSKHAYTFSELERIVGDEDADLDKLNLLLDLIQSRIGANAKERQANLDYNFKQIINSMFPAMHRYFMHCAVKNQDIFQQPLNRDNLILTANSWTRDSYKTINMSELQFDKLRSTKLQFLMKRKETIARIERLKSIKCELKKQGQIFEAALRDIRQEMTPVQSALIIIFGEKNKLRRQFSILTEQFQDQVMPTKHVKCDE